MNKTIDLLFTGDILCDNHDIMSSIKYSNFIDKPLTKTLQSADYTVGNLEVPILQKIPQSMPQYTFSAPTAFAKYLKEAGFDFVSTANNHCLDCSVNGLKENLKNLDNLHIDHTGTYAKLSDSQKIFIKNISGTKVAFLSFTYGTNAFVNHCYLTQESAFHVDLLRKQEHSHKIIRKIKNKFFENLDFFSYRRDKKYLQQLANKISTAKKEADIVIMCLHTGGQYNKHVEHYTKKLCKYISNLGCDTIIANHPHITLGIKKLHKTLAFYSLGNFFATPFTNHNQKDDIPDTSIIVKLTIDQMTKKTVKAGYSIVKTVLSPTPICRNIADIYNEATHTDREHIRNIAQHINKVLRNESNEIKDFYELRIS